MKERVKTLFFQNVANIITLIGLLCAIWVAIIVLYQPEKILLTLVLVLFTGITDFVDGKLARYLKIESTLGKALDRLRDKILVCPLLVVLIYRHLLSSKNSQILATFTASLVFLIILIELLLVVAWFLGLIKQWDVSSNIYGKRKMFFQFLTVCFWMTTIVVEKYLGLKLVFPTIVIINLLLIITIYFGFKSLLEYCNRYSSKQK